MKAAVSRLPAGPETDRMEVTDIQKGRFVFSPVPGEPIRRDSLYRALEGAGYEMTDAWLVVSGRLAAGGHLEALGTGQAFDLAGGRPLERMREATKSGDTVTVHGAWRSGPEADTVMVGRWIHGSDMPEGWP